MSIQISWETSISGTQAFHHVPLLGAELVMTTVHGVITDCSWQLPCQNQQSKKSALADQVQLYLMDPERNQLAVSLYRQGTVYSQKVWDILLNIPFGQVMSYSALAQQIGSGPRAVAQACRTNPYAGIIPCHRVVAKSGVGGFMGQRQGPMVQLKRELLAFEYRAAMSAL